MSKKVTIGAKPTSKSAQASADEWVENRSTGNAPEPMKRLTIDVPASLHARIKSQCALRGVKMADAVRELLEQHFPQS